MVELEPQHDNLENETERPVVQIVRGIILDDGNKILLQKRANGSFKGYWELPGGKTDSPNITAEIAREIEEEIGLQTITSELFTERTNKTNGDRDWKVTYFLVKTQGQISPNPEEVEEVAFFTKDEISNLDNIAFGSKDIIIQYFEEQNFNSPLG